MDTLLLVDDDLSLLETLKMHFEEDFPPIRHRLEVVTARCAAEALEQTHSFRPSVIVLDMMLPDGSGLDLLPALKSRCGQTPIVLVTAFHDMETTIRAMKAGAFDFVHKPFSEPSVLERVVERALQVRDASARTAPAPLEKSTFKLGDIVAVSAHMQQLLKDIGKTAAAPRANVLIQGESGTGKELVARVIHTYSHEEAKPFVGINCSAIVPTLLESELFGHERGAFTGAQTAKAGKLELAHDGTVFLDEIGDMSLPLQAKLLRVLQEREFERVGGNKRLELKARVVAATHRHLSSEVAAGRFREDLYQRLQVVTLRVPPLRDRREDIPELVFHLLKKINTKVYKSVTRVADEVLEMLCQAEWRGNVRELENVLTYAVVQASSDVLVPEEMPSLNPRPVSSFRRRKEDASPLPSLEEAERALISRALGMADGHKGKMCQALGISRPTLDRKLKKFGLAHPN